MIREFCWNGFPAFVLDTVRSSYVFRVLPTGQVEQLYYGARIPISRPEDLAHLTEQRAFAPGNTICYDQAHPELSLEDICLEVSAHGKGDLREPMLELVHADGGRTSDFRFQSAELRKDPPAWEGLPTAYDAPSEDGPEHLILTVVDANYGMCLELHYSVYPDCDCVCRRARLRNESDHPVSIRRFLSYQLDLPDAGWAVSSFHGAWAREMERSTLCLTAGKYVIESRAGCSSSRANPFFMVHSPDAAEERGNCYGFHLLYSGNHYAAVEVGAFGKTRIAAGIQPQGFQWLLEPGRAFESPEAALCFSGEGFGGLSGQLHRFVRRHIVRGFWRDRPRPVLLNSWEACYFKCNERRLLELAAAGKALGIELFVLDDGWFGVRDDDRRSLGDWEANKTKLPGGLSGLGKKLRTLGLDFGLWVEPEMVNQDSALYRAHPDWTLEIPGNPHAEGRNQRLLDLANPAVQDHLIETMSRVFSSADIRYVKWDFNRVFSDVYSQWLPPERQGETAHRYILGLYRIMAALTARFPEVLFEGCASGGNRFDLGILCYFPQIWASDNTDALSRARIQEGYSYGYPPSVFGAHVSACPNHQTLRTTPLDTRFAVAAFGLLGYELDLRDLEREELRELRGQIALYKRWRETFQFGSFYRGRSGNLHAWTCVSPDGSRAVGLLLQELGRPNDPFARFFPRGLDPERRYHFHNLARRVNIRAFGSLVNAVAPFHIRQNSLLHRAAARTVTLPGELEDCTATGAALMRAGVKLKPAFAGGGFNENVRYFPDFAARLYFMSACPGD